MHHQNLEQLKALRLFGMARALEELAHTRERDALTFDDQLAVLIEREAADRANLALTHRLRRAHLRQNACLENLDLRTPRGLDRALVRDLANCRWVRSTAPSWSSARPGSARPGSCARWATKPRARVTRSSIPGSIACSTTSRWRASRAEPIACCASSPRWRC